MLGISSVSLIVGCGYHKQVPLLLSVLLLYLNPVVDLIKDLQIIIYDVVSDENFTLSTFDTLIYGH